MTNEEITALKRMGYRQLHEFTWAKPVAYSVITYHVKARQVIRWFKAMDTRKTEAYCSSTISDPVLSVDALKDAEAEVMNGYNPWSGIWSDTKWDFLTKMEEIEQML
jgi:hypothetical protein